eukprot:TCONS_00032938-protein
MGQFSAFLRGSHLTTNTYSQNWYLFAIIFFSFIQILLTSAPLFGYSSLLVIFKRMDLYHQLCPNSNSTSANSTMYTSTDYDICETQEAALDLPFAFGAFLHNAVKVVIGHCIDRYGSRLCNLTGCLFLIMFGFLLAEVHQGAEYLLYPAFFVLAVSSSFLMLCPYQIVNIMVKRNKAFYICILSGSVDSSTVVFYLFLKLFERGIPLADISLGFIFLCGSMVLLSTIILYPSREILQAELDATQYCKLKPTGLNKKLIDYERKGRADFPLEHFEAGIPDDSCNKHDNNKWNESPLARASLRECLFSWFNIFLIYQVSITMLILWYFIANIDKYLGYITDQSTASEYIKTFGLIQFCGLAVGPLTGAIFIAFNRSAGNENQFLTKIKSLNITSLLLFILTTAFLLILLLQKLSYSIVVFSLFFLCNGLLWCYLSTFYAYVFPPQHYCTLYGFAMVCCGLVSFLQFPLLVLEQKSFGGNMFN